MNELKTFNNIEFGEIRVSVEDGIEWFNANDVCEALDYKNSREALRKHVDADDVTKRDAIVNTGLGDYQTEINYINESGLYSLIFGSELKKAKKFKKWITSEVLPAIRKTGKYEMKTNKNKTLDLEIKLKNSRSRMANAYLKIANNPIFPNEYRQIMLTYAANELSGTPVIPLPSSEKRTFSATEIGEKLGISANKVGTLANTHGLKTDEFGKFVWDRSPYSAKQVEAFRYYENVIPMLEGILKGN